MVCVKPEAEPWAVMLIQFSVKQLHQEMAYTKIRGNGSVTTLRGCMPHDLCHVKIGDDYYWPTWRRAKAHRSERIGHRLAAVTHPVKCRSTLRLGAVAQR